MRFLRKFMILIILIILSGSSFAQNINNLVIEGKYDSVAIAIKENPKLVNSRARGGQTLLWFAADNGNTKIAKLLLDNKAEINLQDIYKRTPLQIAVYRGNLGFVKLLVERGAQINTQNNYTGFSPLHESIAEGFSEIAKYLIDHNANTTLKDSNGKTPLLIAVDYGNIEMTEYLLKSGCSINVREKFENKSAVHMAAINGYKKILELLIKYGADINDSDKANNTPLDYAARYGHLSAAGLLQENSAKRNTTENSYGYSSLLKNNMQNGEAVIWFLYNCGWAVKTNSSLLIFDYWEHKANPPELLLANGHINPEEIKDLDIFVFTTHADDDHYDPVIWNWKKKLKNITYFFGWKVNEEPGNQIVKDGETIKTGTVEVTGVQNKGGNQIHFLVKTGGLTIYHAGDGTSDRNINIDKIKKHTESVDFAFISYFGGGDISVAQKLEPRILFPMHLDSIWMTGDLIKQVSQKCTNTTVPFYKYSGDHFYYRDGKLKIF